MENSPDSLRRLTPVDRWIATAQAAASVMAGTPLSQRPDPARAQRAGAAELGKEQKRHSAALMRVNHVGEICAQALYEAQAMATRDEKLRAVFAQTAVEESDHLAWTRGRVEELGGRVSALVPVWYLGAFAIGWGASVVGDRASLGFMAETTFPGRRSSPAFE